MGKHQEAFYEMLAARSNPKPQRAPKRLGAFAEFEERMKREMAAAGQYPESDLRSNPYYSNPGADGRLSPDEMAQYKGHIEQLLASGMSHADVRKQLGNMSFPLYQAIRRSGGTKGARPVHRGSAHLLRNPAGMRVPGPGTRFTALSSYYDIAGMGQYNSQMNMRFEVNADGSATHIRGGGDSHGNTLPAAAVRRLFEDGHCGGLGSNTSLSKPEIE